MKINRNPFFFSIIFFGIAFFALFLSPVYAVEQPVSISLDRQVNAGKTSQNKVSLQWSTSLSDVDLILENKTDKQLTEMKISETGLFDAMQWEQYSAMKPWKFSSPDGQKSVHAQFKTENGEIIASSATFVYDTTAPDTSFKLVTKSIGPDSMNIIGNVTGYDKYSVMDYDYRIGLEPSFSNNPWRAHEGNRLEIPIDMYNSSYKNGEILTVYFQARDQVGNMSPVQTDTCTVDKTPPVMYVDIPPSDNLTQTISVMAYDEFSTVEKMFITNDERFIDNVVEMPYQQTIKWIFGDKRVVWVQLKDSVGNKTTFYPAYLAYRSITPIPWPTWTPTQMPTSTINPTVAHDPKYLEFQKKIAALEKGQKEIEKENKNTQKIVVQQTEKISLIENIQSSIVSFLKQFFSFGIK